MVTTLTWQVVGVVEEFGEVVERIAAKLGVDVVSDYCFVRNMHVQAPGGASEVREAELWMRAVDESCG